MTGVFTQLHGRVNDFFTLSLLFLNENLQYHNIIRNSYVKLQLAKTNSKYFQVPAEHVDIMPLCFDSCY